MLKQITSRIKTKSNDSIFQIYLLTYKKFKYWIGVFYLISFSIILLFSTSGIYGLLGHYSQMKTELPFYKFLNSSSFISTKNKSHNLEILPFEYKPNVVGWAEMKKHEVRLFKSKRAFLDNLNVYLKNQFTDEFNNYLGRDTTLVLKLMNKNDHIIKKILGNGISTATLGIRQKRIFAQEVYDSVKAINIFKTSKKIRDVILNLYPLDDNLRDSSISSIYNNIIQRIAIIKKFLSKNVVKIPNSEVSVNTKTTLFLALGILYILTIYVIILYLTFKYYEQKIDKHENPHIKVPSIRNIFRYFKFNIYLKLEQFISIVTNIIFPIFIYYFFLIKMKDILTFTLVFSLSLTLHIITLYIIFKNKRIRQIFYKNNI